MDDILVIGVFNPSYRVICFFSETTIFRTFNLFFTSVNTSLKIWNTVNLILRDIRKRISHNRVILCERCICNFEVSMGAGWKNLVRICFFKMHTERPHGPPLAWTTLEIDESEFVQELDILTALEFAL